MRRVLSRGDTGSGGRTWDEPPRGLIVSNRGSENGQVRRLEVENSGFIFPNRKIEFFA